MAHLRLQRIWDFASLEVQRVEDQGLVRKVLMRKAGVILRPVGVTHILTRSSRSA